MFDGGVEPRSTVRRSKVRSGFCLEGEPDCSTFRALFDGRRVRRSVDLSRGTTWVHVGLTNRHGTTINHGEIEPQSTVRKCSGNRLVDVQSNVRGSNGHRLSTFSGGHVIPRGSNQLGSRAAKYGSTRSQNTIVWLLPWGKPDRRVQGSDRKYFRKVRRICRVGGVQGHSGT